MKKFTHALIACKAVERLQNVDLSDQNKPFADFLFDWFKKHKDGVIKGAWYPDDVICDQSTSHGYKYQPIPSAVVVSPLQNEPADPPLPCPSASPFRNLPSTSLQYAIGQKSRLYNLPFTINPKNNLPDRCEAVSHAVIDNLRIRTLEKPDSPLSVTDAHVALILFMLSHYVADGHMPMHCDNRDDEFIGFNIHAEAEECWEREVVTFYEIDRPNQCFIYDDSGFPKLRLNPTKPYAGSILNAVQQSLDKRPFRVGYGDGNDNVREYILAVSQYSYLTSYAWLPYGITLSDLDRPNLQSAKGIKFREMSIAALSDAIDAVARVWLHDLRRFIWWKQAMEANQ